MKKRSVIRRGSIGCLILLILSLSTFQNLNAQQYSEMKIIHKNGVTIDGEDGKMTESSVTLMVDDVPETYPLDEVQLVMVKKGLAGKYALAAGGGCALIVLIAVIASPTDEGEQKYTTGQLIGGGLIWVAIFTGGGYLLGSALDDWNTIYTAPAQSSIFKKFKFGFGASRKGEFRVGLSYNF